MPTEYHLQQGWNAVKDNFIVKDADGKDAYKVKGTGFTWGSQLTFHDMDGKELAAIKQTAVATLYPKFEVTRDGKPWAEVSKENMVGLTKKEVDVNIPGDNNYKILGDRMAWHFKIVSEDGRTCGTVDKKWGIRDNYGVQVEDGENTVEILLCAILIDQIYHDDDSQ